MGVYIKGMDIPKSCSECFFVGWSNLHQTAKCNLQDRVACFDNYSAEYQRKRADDCPLIEIPKGHGDLIDKDAHIAKLKEWYCGKCDNYHGLKCRACWVDDAMSDIDDAPTILEAE